MNLSPSHPIRHTHTCACMLNAKMQHNLLNIGWWCQLPERDHDPPLGASLKELMRLLSTSSRLNSWLAHQPAVSLREAFLITKWAPLAAPPPTPTLHLPSICQGKATVAEDLILDFWAAKTDLSLVFGPLETGWKKPPVEIMWSERRKTSATEIGLFSVQLWKGFHGLLMNPYYK